MEELLCASCKRKITNMKGTVRFKCPKCGNYDIIRCAHCRQTASKYYCHECGFSGPN